MTSTKLKPTREKKPATSMVHVRVTAEERARITRSAERSRVTVSEYLRVCALSGIHVRAVK